MDDKKPNPIKEPEAESPAPEGPSATPAAESPAPATPAAPAAAPKKSNKALIIILVVILLAAIGVGACFLLNKPQNTPTPEQQGSSEIPEEVEIDPSSKESSSDSPKESSSDKDNEASASISEKSLSPIFRKLLLLHHPSIQRYLSDEITDNSFETDKFFSFYSGQSYIENLYSSASGLPERDKFTIVTDYMAGHGYFETLTNFNVPADFFASLNPTFCKDASVSGYSCDNSQGVAVSEDKVAKVYQEFFGELPTSFENPTQNCGAKSYSGTYHIFHSIPFGGCGGAYFIGYQAYIEKYTESGNNVYVYLRIATTDELNHAIYKVFLSPDKFYDSTAGTDITPDESLVYTHTSNMSRVITSDNYTEFEPYRFVFEKDGDNFYFKAVEKL